jgi:hypothetical protein
MTIIDVALSRHGMVVCHSSTAVFCSQARPKLSPVSCKRSLALLLIQLCSGRFQPGGSVIDDDGRCCCMHLPCAWLGSSADGESSAFAPSSLKSSGRRGLEGISDSERGAEMAAVVVTRSLFSAGPLPHTHPPAMHTYTLPPTRM